MSFKGRLQRNLSSHDHWENYGVFLKGSVYEEKLFGAFLLLASNLLKGHRLKKQKLVEHKALYKLLNNLIYNLIHQFILRVVTLHQSNRINAYLSWCDVEVSGLRTSGYVTEQCNVWNEVSRLYDKILS